MRFREIREKKKMAAKDDPCWKDYHMVDTKIKDGREVPNCVPGRKGVKELAEQARELADIIKETRYSEKLAQTIYDENPNLDTSGRAEDLMSAGYDIARMELDPKRARYLFAYDEDFPADLIAAYAVLQQGKGVQENEGYDIRTKRVTVFKDKSGKPIGEIGIDLDASPGNGNWYVHHYATKYNVVGFDNAKEAKQELMYAEKYPEQMNEQGVQEGLNVKQIKKDLDSGMSVDAVIGKHANRRLTNTDEIRRVIQQHAWEKRKNKPKDQGIAEGLNEFAPGGGDEGPGDDPYKYPKPEHYRRSIDFFGQFEADHFDREDMNDATGEFKGYWDYDGKPRLIAYFKFDNPQKTDSNDPGMGWYYEPNEDMGEGVQEGHDRSHGSPYDRGSADRYYGRPARPHKGGVGGKSGPESTDLTREEIAAYMAGYHEETDRKQWESVEETEALGLMAKTSRTGVKQTNPYIAMLMYKLQHDKPISRRERQDLEDYLKKIGARPQESETTEAMKLSDLPPTMRRRLTMKDIEAERPKGGYRYRVHHSRTAAEGPKDFMNKDSAEEYARAVGGRVENLDESDTYTIKNTKTGKTYHVSKYPITPDAKVYKQIKSAGGEHAHAAIYKNGQPVDAEKTEKVGEIEERELTAHELERREEIVKGMKKNRADFEKRYGDRAKSVMYATATKMAKNEDINESKRLSADEGHYYCEAERQIKPIPEGYIKVAKGYIMKKI